MRSFDRGERGQRVVQAMRGARSQIERDLTPADLRCDVPALALRGMLQFANLRPVAETQDFSVPFDRADARRKD